MSKTNEMAQLGLINRSSSTTDATLELRRATKLLLTSIFAKLKLESAELENHFKSDLSLTLENVLNYALTVAQMKHQDDALIFYIQSAILDTKRIREEREEHYSEIGDFV